MSVLLGFFGSGIGKKAALYGGIALAVLLGVFFIYRAGGRSARSAARDKTIRRTADSLKVREEIEREISEGNRAGGDRGSVERLRSKWARD